jgi:hypothetical protein
MKLEQSNQRAFMEISTGFREQMLVIQVGLEGSVLTE